MATKFCCVTWLTLYKELADAKMNEINALVKDKGIPASVFAPIIALLEEIDNHCPKCAYDLVNDREMVPYNVTAVVPVRERTIGVGSHAPERAHAPAPKLIPCPACKGLGSKGEDAHGIEIKCGRCLGEKFVGNGNDWVPKDAHADVIQRNMEIAEQVRLANKPIPHENTAEGVLGKP